MPTQDEVYVRQAFALAREAAQRGDHPFGALLVSDGGVILTAGNTVHTERDPTRHAELNLVSQAARRLPAETVARATLYTSTEPCVMCTGAIYWVGVRRIVFGCSAEALARSLGEDWAVPCRETLARLHSAIDVTGPVLEEAGLEVHAGYWPSRRE